MQKKMVQIYKSTDENTCKKPLLTPCPKVDLKLKENNLVSLLKMTNYREQIFSGFNCLCICLSSVQHKQLFRRMPVIQEKMSFMLHKQKNVYLLECESGNYVFGGWVNVVTMSLGPCTWDGGVCCHTRGKMMVTPRAVHNYSLFHG